MLLDGHHMPIAKLGDVMGKRQVDVSFLHNEHGAY